MTKEEIKAYKKAWHEANKDKMKAWREAHKEERKEYLKAYYQAHKESEKAKCKAWHEAHKEERKASMKAWCESHKEEIKAYNKKYIKADVNSLGQTKNSIRLKSRIILKKSGIKIPGYQIHHCFTYDDPTKFIYCSKEIHLQIHKFLRDNNIDADTDHYDKIKHLLDENVVTFGL